ncbi:MAG: hypothetical protein SFU85_05445 [Candidatus Methylacidiphilales bacterium]|nr:hypothetical protein [Candidatus Methylacidiphilales bacterium]
MRARALLMGLVLAVSTVWGAEGTVAPRTIKLEDVKLSSSYPLKRGIVTTTFWIGQGSTGYNSTTNYKSAWDGSWTRNFGGTDCPDKRVGVAIPGAVTLPKRFAPTLNPYYVALPFNDIKYPKLARQYVPWWDADFHRKNPFVSQCKGRWIMIEFKGRVCFAQWEDVGPLRYDSVGYVFGNDRPTREHSQAGLDVSPAVQDYLGLDGMDTTNWRFVEDDEVPYGPWIEYAEQAIVFSVIKAEYKKKLN